MHVISLLELRRGLRHLVPLLKVDSRDSQTQQSGVPVYRRRLLQGNSLFDPVDMSQAAPYPPARPDHPAPRPPRTRLLLIPGGTVLLLPPIPRPTYPFAENPLSQAQTS